ncbi:HSP20-like chaperone [Tothia fuscella]|uniref:HSP20-like chaperone n=1 Tax=Tothia fuscella TaxID=1048955 RepID=A0A9P4U1B7_9PEZI|nr:HSP20-like chaperone [Tothia fuscella]
MSLFQEFSPIFRMVNDFDRVASRCVPREPRFTPSFDVKELKDSYELQGELPGVDQKDVSIEWTDATTLAIKGRTEHRRQRGSPPQKTAASTPTPAQASDSATSSEKATSEHEYQKPSVEEEDGSTSTTDDFVDVASPNSESTVAEGKKPVQEAVAAPTRAQAPAPAAEQARYWVSERSVGSFARTFTFPVRIDQDAVKASLKNGILSVVIPKLKVQPRKITIE